MQSSNITTLPTSEEERVKINKILVSDGILYLPHDFFKSIGLGSIVKFGIPFRLNGVMISVRGVYQLLQRNHLLVTLESTAKGSSDKFSEFLDQFAEWNDPLAT